MTQRLVILVEFTLPAARLARFLELVQANARQSLASEPGCRCFDVSTAQGDGEPTVLLYEIYDDLAAFQAHLALDHVKAFLAVAKTLVTGQQIRRFDLLA